MITESYVQIELSGKNFSPIFFEEQTNIFFDSKIEVNEINKFGRFKGRSSEFGNGIRTIEIQNLKNELSTFSQFISNNINILEDFSVLLTLEYKFQCNYEIPIELMKFCVEHNIELCLTTYEGEYNGQ